MIVLVFVLMRDSLMFGLEMVFVMMEAGALFLHAQNGNVMGVIVLVQEQIVKNALKNVDLFLIMEIKEHLQRKWQKVHLFKV